MVVNTSLINLLFVEDQPPTIRGVTSLLSSKGYNVLSANSLAEGREIIKSIDIDLLLLDLALEPENDPNKTLLFITELKENYPRIVTVIYSTNRNLQPITVQKALEEGVSYIIKETTPEDKLDEAIRLSLSGCVVYSPSVVSYFGQLLTPKEKALLTPGELIIAFLISKGFTNQKIALETSKKETRVREQVTNILRKLQLGSRTEVAIWFKDTYPNGLPEMKA